MVRGIAHGRPFRKLTNEGHWKRLDILKTLVNGLIRHERIETTFAKAHETQKYMERLIKIARYGEEDDYCKDMMDFWAEDADTKKKVYDVLLPRFDGHAANFTRLAVMPREKRADNNSINRYAVLELKGNPLPPLPTRVKNPNTLQNVLLEAARKDWDRQSAAKKD